jgi:toxin ParE1/3/4
MISHQFSNTSMSEVNAARRTSSAIQKTIELIGEFPEGGRLAGEQTTRVLPVGRYPYLIYWSIEAGEVWIVHIRHARRRPWKSDG